MTTAILLVLLLQADPAREVERLRSDSIVDRDDAARNLKELGTKAIPALEKAAGDPDREVAERARLLVDAIRLRETLTPAVRKALPGIEDRMARGGPVWMDFLKELYDRMGEPPYDSLRAEDVAAFLSAGARAARTQEEKFLVCDLCAPLRVRTPPEELLRFLSDRDKDVVVRALNNLQNSERTADAAAILPLLKHADPQVRERSVSALGGIRAPGTAPAILGRLKDQAPSVSYSALCALGALRVREALPDILALREDPYNRTQGILPYVLAELGGGEMIPHLLPMLRSKYPETRANAAKGLGMLGAEAELQALVPLLRDEKEIVRRDAAEVLGEWHVIEAIPDLVRLLEDEDPLTQWQAGGALVTMGAVQTAARILALLKSENPALRRGAVYVAGALGVREAIPELRGFLKSADRTVSGEAARALAVLGDRDSLPAIRPLLLKTDESDICEALAILQDRDSIDDLRRFESKFPELQANAVGALAQLGDREAVPRLKAMIGDRMFDRRLHGAYGLGTLNAAGSAPLVATLLRDEEKHIRLAALEALTLLDAKGFLSEIEKLLEDPDLDVRLSAARQLCALGSRSGLALLFERSRMPSELNALRRPELWARLRSKKTGATLSGTTVEVLGRIAALAGIRLVRPEPVGELEKAWQGKPVWAPDYGGQTTVVDALQQVVVGPYEFVLEADSIRLLPRKEARALWRAWAEAERK